MMWSDWGWSLGAGANFILAEGRFLALSGRESSLVQTFCESCVHLDITHPSIHMTQRFVIQGCPTSRKQDPALPENCALNRCEECFKQM